MNLSLCPAGTRHSDGMAEPPPKYVAQVYGGSICRAAGHGAASTAPDDRKVLKQPEARLTASGTTH